MCGNRVDALESRIKELEASVEGLTDELVEAKVRIRELEGALGGDATPDGPGTVGSEGGADATGESGLVVPEAGGAEPDPGADTHKTEGGEGEDSTDDSESDIIVA